MMPSDLPTLTLPSSSTGGEGTSEVVHAKGLMDEETLKKALDPAGLTEPGIPGQ